MRPGPDDVCFLLGAGASVPAKVPTSQEMISSMEEGFAGRARKKPPVAEDFRHLYWHVKSSIQFARGLEGAPSAPEFNIETLVAALTELERHIAHPLYPFVATWNQRLWDLAGRGFKEVENFKVAVLSALQSWILVEGIDQNAAYLAGLKDLRRSFEHPLRIFSLNYDRCIESLEADGISPFHVEQGFSTPEINPDRTWDWRRMQSDLAGRDTVEVRNTDIFLYKLHGSIDWSRDDDEQLVVLDPSEIRSADMRDVQIIFGREGKLDARDPFSYYFSEFRRACKAANLIVSVGYSFRDLHVNQILAGALRERNAKTRLLVVTSPIRGANEDDSEVIAHRLAGVTGSATPKKREKIVADIKRRLSIKPDGAENFFRKTSSWEMLGDYLPASDDPFAT